MGQDRNLHPLCKRCPNGACSGVTVEAAVGKAGCWTLFWLTVGELTFEEALEAKWKQHGRSQSKVEVNWP